MYSCMIGTAIGRGDSVSIEAGLGLRIRSPKWAG